MANTVEMFKETGDSVLNAGVAKGHISAHWNQGWRFKYTDDLEDYFGRRAPEMATDHLQIEATATDSLPAAQRRDFYGLLDQMRAIHDAKASDYAPGEDRFKNFRQCEAMGVSAFEGAVVRMGDKMSRIMNLIAKERRGEGAAVKNESITDTLFDLAVYALIAIQLREEQVRD